MESGQKPYPALLRSDDDGTPGVMPLPGGVVEDSAAATCSTELCLWVNTPPLRPTTVASMDVTFLVEGVVTCSHLCPHRLFELSLSSPLPSYPLPILACASLLLALLSGEIVPGCQSLLMF
jgi:hypothetical protein